MDTERALFFFIALVFMQSLSYAQTTSQEKPMVIISSSRNTKNYCIKNLDSTINQEYSNYRIIWIDDASDDGTPEIVGEYLKKKDLINKVTFIKNKERCWAAQNYYTAIHTCKDNEIILIVDGDDWLTHNNVLQVVNKAYQAGAWLTYGSWKHFISENEKPNEEIPCWLIKRNNYRYYRFMTGHLRTFYTWLFKKIKLEDLMYKGNFTKMFWDNASMIPMVEMAQFHTHFISDILYIHNNEIINDRDIDNYKKKRLEYVAYLESLPKYTPLKNNPLKKATTPPEK